MLVELCVPNCGIGSLGNSASINIIAVFIWHFQTVLLTQAYGGKKYESTSHFSGSLKLSYLNTSSLSAWPI